MTDEKNTTPETAKPEPTLTNPVEQSFAEAERLAEQAEAAAKDEPCCDMPKAEEAAPEAPKTEVPTPPQYQPPQGTKSRIAAGVLAILFGVFGVHNFYIGKTGLGIAQLAITVCSCGTLAIVSEIWGIIEGVRLLQGTIYTDGHGMKFVD